MMLSETPLDGISHVVVDEVHERDTQTDLLLLLLRELLPTRPNLRVVLMSATVQAETFTKYFGDCEVLNAKGRTFPVEEYHLEQALELTGHVLLPDSPCRLQEHQQYHRQQYATAQATGLKGRSSTTNCGTGAEQFDAPILNPDYSEGRYDGFSKNVHECLKRLNE